MNEKEFREYVYEQRRQGRSDSQIARSLGMSLAHFMGRLNGVDVDNVDPPKQKVETPKPEKKTEAKKEKSVDIPKVEESKEEKKAEDLSWME